MVNMNPDWMRLWRIIGSPVYHFTASFPKSTGLACRTGKGKSSSNKPKHKTMKTFYTILFLLLIEGTAKAQAVYVDPTVAGAQAAHSAIINNRLRDTNEKLSL